MNKRKRLLTLLINGVLLSSLCVAGAVDTTAGTGNGIAYGTGSTANNTKDIAIGNKANVQNYVNQNGGVAIGANAHVENMAGQVEAAVGMGQTSYSGGFLSSARVPADPSKVVSSIAIVNNTPDMKFDKLFKSF